ncbi:MAG: inosine/xanthosine triphosphatase [Candidatus Taylorbacteria bacterium]|nr:inosine/xanthosine triphosphatase [Candidatus Taylorbacteria bacterium]
MRINVGTKNAAKLRAVKNALASYEWTGSLDVISVDVASGVPDQPLSMAETVEGAKNRAKSAYPKCQYSIGLENGLIEVPGSMNGRMDVCCCAIYDGQNFHLGLSSGFELPRSIQKFVDQGLNMTDAALRSGLTTNAQIGSEEGVISLLSKGRIRREDYIKEAVMMAMIQIENRAIYAKG